MAAATNPKIIASPGSDRAFTEAAHRHVADGAETPLELERRLKPDYPLARVVDGIRDGTRERWYAYRDGRWVPDE